MTTEYLKDMFTRIENAHESFTKLIMELSECTEEEARKVKDLYLKNKLATLDSQSGTITVKHGAYLELSVIQNAINYQ